MSIKKGIYAATMTVINKDLTVNVDATIKHAEKLIQQGCHATVIGGSTGMMQLISSDEKRKLIDNIAISKFKDDFVFGTGTNSLSENVELMKRCLKNGIDRFLIMPSAYYKYNDEGVYNYYKNIVQQVPESKIILYNFEKLSGYKFSINLVEKLAKEFPKQIVGVKDSSYNLFENLKLENFSVLPGSEAKLLKGLECGCSGIITATCNATAQLARRVYDDFFSGKVQLYNQKLIDVRNEFEKYNLISALHTFKSKDDETYRNVLPPLDILNSEDDKKLIQNLEKLNFQINSQLAA